MATRAVQLLFKEELQHEQEAECDKLEGYKELGEEEKEKERKNKEVESAIREGDDHHLSKS